MELLTEKLKEFGIELNKSQIELFNIYYEFLNKFNEHTNIVSDASKENVLIKHFADSLGFYLIDETKNKKNLSVIDIGCGGGFPGVPLMILFEDWKLTAVDSVGKKINFIKELSLELGLNDRITAINKRAEDLAQNPEYREKFDIATARAVSRLNIISEYCLPFVKQGGIFAPYKSKGALEELNEANKALHILKARYKGIVEYNIDETDRNILIIEKLGTTPEKYPRKSGIPKKNPL